MNVIQLLEGCIASSGYTWIPSTNLKMVAYKNNVNISNLKSYINSQKLYAYYKNGEYLFSSPTVVKAENGIANEVFRIMYGKKRKVPESILNALIDEAEKVFNLTLHSEQREAVKCAVLNSFCIITGGPGTGKTCVLNVINYVLMKLNRFEQICFLAPTGKAARRITESTGKYAETLHKKLKINANSMNPTLIDATSIIADETSMLDVFVTNAFFKGIKTGTRAILVGDIDQLPSVGPGAILRDLLESDVVPFVRLTKTFRQANESTLFRNIYYIRQGYTEIEEGDDFQIIEAGKNVIEQVINAYLQEIKTYGIDNVVCLTPFRKAGKTSSNVMNVRLQAIINPKGNKPYVNSKNGYFQVGDPVMQLKNRTECANGDVGKIIAVNSDESISVEYIDCVVKYSKFDEITLAYAMSIHKSQGSEYQSVVSTILNEHGDMLQRNLFYTAVTRAKKKFTVIREKDATDKAIKTVLSSKRITLLTEKLIYMKKKYERVYNM